MMDNIQVSELIKEQEHYWRYSFLCRGDSYVDVDRLEDWCKQEFGNSVDRICINRPGTRYCLIYFSNEEDALRFKLTIC